MKPAGLFVVISLLLPGLLFGQRTAASISGTVTDPSGALIPRAHVSTTNTATGAVTSADTNAQGFYAFTHLEPGPYQLRVDMTAFEGYVRNGITLQVGQSMTVDVSLTVGSTTAEVTVMGAPPLVDTRNQSTSFAITPQFTEEIPLNGRNVLQLMALAPDTSTYSGPGSSQQSATRLESSAGYVNASGGAMMNSTVFYLDSSLNMDPYTQVSNVFPNPDAVQEFTFVTNSANAKYDGMGGGVVNAVTRGGTNRFHGSAFEYVRNGHLNGRNFFAATDDTLIQNQFGGSLGGPIQKDKTFAFFSFQRTTVRAGTTASAVFGPTYAELGKNPDGSPHYCPGSTTEVCGDWSKIPSQLYNTVLTRDANGLPLTFTTDRSVATPFPNNQVPVSLYVPIASKVLALVPQGDPITGRVNYLRGTVTNDMQYVARVDRNFGDKWRISGVFLDDPYSTPAVIDPKNLLTDTYNRDWHSIRGTLNAVYIVSPNLVTTVGATYNLILMKRHGNPGFLGLLDLGANYPNFNPGLHETGGSTGWWGWGVNDHLVTNRDQIEVSHNWTYTRGNHTLDFGAEYINTHSKEGFDYFGSGYSSSSCAYTGYSPLDFMLGQNCLFNQYGAPYVFLRNAVPVIYANDAWRLKRRLTLNLGLRWEPWEAFTDHSAGKIGNLISPAAFAAGTHSARYPNLPPGLLVPGDPGVPGSLAPADWKLFDPRVGLAWDVKGDGNTSVRAGFGIYHNKAIGLSYDNMEVSPPFFTSYVITDPKVPWYSPYNAAPYNGVLPSGVTSPPPSNTQFTQPLSDVVAFSPTFKPPATAQWNLTVEQQLGWGVLLRASYEASESWHMFDSRNINAATYIPGNNPDGSAKSTASNVTQRRPWYPYYGGQVIVNETTSTSSFNSLAISIEKRMTGNLSLLAGYRWAKCLDIGTRQDFASNDFTDVHHTRLDRGLCAADIAAQLKAAFVYRLPSLRSWGFAGRTILGGWEMSGILNWKDGYPYSVSSNYDANLDGNVNDRANLVGNPHLPAGRSEAARLQEWFNTAAFQNAGVGTDGSSPRDFLRGPRFSDLDYSLIKSFPIRHGPLKETQNIQFRAEFFNIFNHPNFGSPVSQVGSAQFGKIVSAGSPRIIQFALKFTF